MSREFASTTPAELAARLEENPDIVIVGVQPAEVHARRRIPGSTNACVYEVAFPQRIRELNADPAALVVVYGVSAQTLDAAMAAHKLDRLGFKHVEILDGGLEAWSAAGLPLQGEAADTEPYEHAKAGAAVALPEGALRVDTAASRIEWTGRNAGGKHHGTVALARGEFTVRHGALTGSLDIDMRGIADLDLADPTLRAMLEAHLKSDDFFFVEEHPTATLTIHRARRIASATSGAQNFALAMELTLRGRTRPLDVPATVSVTDEGRLALECHFDLDRTQWGALYGSGRFFRFLGRHLVFDPITIDCRIVAG